MRAVLEDVISAAGRQPDLWPGVLDSMARSIGCAGAILFGLAGGLPAYASSDLDVSAMSSLASSLRECRSSGAFADNLAGSEKAVRPVAEHEFEAGAGTRLADSGIQPAWVLSLTGRRSALLGFSTGRQEARPEPAGLNGLSVLAPALLDSVNRSAQLCDDRYLGNMLARAGAGRAAAVVAPGRHLLHATEGFRQAVDPWMEVAEGRLVGRLPEAEREIEAAVERAFARSVGVVVPFHGEEGGVSAVLHLMAVSVTSNELLPGAVLAVLATSESTVTCRPELLRRVFELTGAEAEVLAAILDGGTVGEIAVRQNKSTLTVRNQLKSVFSKVGCRRQADLIRKVHAILPIDVSQLQQDSIRIEAF